jgi:hypothetical protein
MQGLHDWLDQRSENELARIEEIAGLIIGALWVVALVILVKAFL